MSKSQTYGLTIMLGTCLTALLGTAYWNFGVGVALGVAVGVAIAVILRPSVR